MIRNHQRTSRPLTTLTTSRGAVAFSGRWRSAAATRSRASKLGSKHPEREEQRSAEIEEAAVEAASDLVSDPVSPAEHTESAQSVVDDLDTRVSNFEGQVEGLREEIGALRESLDKVLAKLDTLTNIVSDVRVELANLQGKVSNLPTTTTLIGTVISLQTVVLGGVFLILKFAIAP